MDILNVRNSLLLDLFFSLGKFVLLISPNVSPNFERIPLSRNLLLDDANRRFSLASHTQKEPQASQVISDYFRASRRQRIGMCIRPAWLDGLGERDPRALRKEPSHRGGGAGGGGGAEAILRLRLGPFLHKFGGRIFLEPLRAELVCRMSFFAPDLNRQSMLC